MKITSSPAIALALLACAVGVLSGAAEPCRQYANQLNCDANTTCTWCKSAAVPSSCNTRADAGKLPPAVFACDNTTHVPTLSTSETHVTYYVKHQEQRVQALKARFDAVSYPDSNEWGQFLSFEEVVRLQTPLTEHTASVIAHARALGATSINPTQAGDKIHVIYPFAQGSEGLRDTLFAPPAVREAIDFASVGTKALHPDRVTPRSFPAKKKAFPAKIPSTDTGLGGTQDCLFDKAVPPCIRKAYGIDAQANATAFNAQTVVVNQGFKASDLATFERRYFLPKQTVVKEIGKNDGTAGDEATLDVQFIIGSGQLVPTWWVYINGHSANPFDNWITWASNTTQIPFVHSLSVGEPEDAIAKDNGGEAFITRMNNEMMALGARGVTIVFASGDSGFVSAQKYPASSPYVTSVGGTTWGAIFKGDQIGVDSETTGGFSSLASNNAQKYQTAAVSNFIHNTHGTRPAGNINAKRRCVPDLAAYSTGFYTVQDGSDQVIGGTSAATPVVAGMFGAINDALIGAGHSPLGFVNPFLYANEDAFLDVTEGDNGGYAAVKGYDPASGLGTFSPTTFGELRKRALAGRLAQQPAAPLHA